MNLNNSLLTVNIRASALVQRLSNPIRSPGIEYRAEKKSLQILLSSTQAGPGRKVKQEQEGISRNHVPRLFLGSVVSQSW